jgi:hypothetical protein
VSIGSELRELKRERELLTAEYVVEWARSHPNSALYKAPQFCGWSTKKAAYQHWLWGARALMALHVTYENGQRQLVSLSLDRTRDGGGYRDVDDVLRDRSLSEIMLKDALNELDRVQIKYDAIKELTAVWREVKKVRRTVTRRQRRGRVEETRITP